MDFEKGIVMQWKIRQVYKKRKLVGRKKKYISSVVRKRGLMLREYFEHGLWNMKIGIRRLKEFIKMENP